MVQSVMFQCLLTFIFSPSLPAAPLALCAVSAQVFVHVRWIRNEGTNL